MGCSSTYGLIAACFAAGPYEIRGFTPHSTHELSGSDKFSGLVNPRSDLLCHYTQIPPQLWTLHPFLQHRAFKLGVRWVERSCDLSDKAFDGRALPI